MEEIFETLTKEVHDHHVVGLVIVRLLVAHEVKVRHAGYTQGSLTGLGLTLATQLVDQLRLPVEHDVLLMLNGFFLRK